MTSLNFWPETPQPPERLAARVQRNCLKQVQLFNFINMEPFFTNHEGPGEMLSSSRDELNAPQKTCYFVNKRILITGASSGLGAALSYWYLNNGAKVALVGRNLAALKSIGCCFRNQAICFQVDLTVDTQCLQMHQTIV
jgi:hypothetical protein